MKFLNNFLIVAVLSCCVLFPSCQDDCVETEWYADNDGDGFGDANNSLTDCEDEGPDGYVSNSSDGDDTDASIGACTVVEWYADADGDGFGDANTVTNACDDMQPEGYVSNADDLNDDSANIGNVTNAEKAVAVIESIQSADVTAIEAYVSEDNYVQHNLDSPDGRAALIQLVSAAAPDVNTVDIKRTLTDGDYVILHTEYFFFGEALAGFDVFRFEDGLIVEHWDNLSPIIDDMDGTTQFDGATEITDLDQTEANRTVIQNTIDNLFIAGVWSTTGDYFDLDNYIQHSVGFGADAAGLLDLLGNLPDGTPFYDSLKFIHAEGNFVLTMSEGFPDATTGLSSAYYDLFRLENGKIIEHWDIIQEIPAEADWANTNGKW